MREAMAPLAPPPLLATPLLEYVLRREKAEIVSVTKNMRMECMVRKRGRGRPKKRWF